MASSESPSNALIKAVTCSPLPLPPPNSLAARWLLGPLAIFSYILSLPVLAFGIWLVTTSGYSCESLLHTQELRVAIAVGLFLVFIVSNFVSYYGPKLLMPGHLVLSIMLVMMLTVGLSLIGTYKMETRGLPGTPMWLKHRIDDGGTWDQVKNCIRDVRICEDLAYRTMLLAPSDFSSLKLSAIESGCCKPPDHCGMKYVNATYWKPVARRKARIDGATGATSAASTSTPTSTLTSHYGSDCPAWVNESRSLCYNCRSCKNGFMRAIASRWRKNGVFLIVMSVLLVAVHMVRFVLLMTKRNRA